MQPRDPAALPDADPRSPSTDTDAASRGSTPVGLPVRLDFRIEADGRIVAGDVANPFRPGDSDSLLRSYLGLVRRMRRAGPRDELQFRREDVEHLAQHLGTTGEDVLDRLGAIAGASSSQRRALAGLFLAGALVISAGVPAAAAVASPRSGSDTMTGAPADLPTTTVVVEQPTEPVPVVLGPATVSYSDGSGAGTTQEDGREVTG